MNASRTLSDELCVVRKKRITPLPDYTRGEEIVNMVTHIIGGALAIAAIPLLVVAAALHGNPWAIVTGAVYGVALVMMFTVSSVYHGLKPGKAKRVMRVIDHCDIYFLIAGTYTPVCLLALPGRAGRWLLGAIWFLAAAGILIKAFWITCPKWFSSVLYILMGWLCVFAFGPLLAVLPRGAFAWLLAGGISYSLGAVIYALHLREFDRRHPYFGTHEIFHVLIMAGTFCHYLVMFRYLVFFPV